MKKQSKKNYDGIFAILAAFIVLFSTMLNPIVSAIIAIVALLAFGIRQFYRR